MNNQKEMNEIIDKISNIRVAHPQYSEALKLIRYCHESYGREKQPELLFLAGESGIGKTTLCENYKNEHPRIETDTVDKIPVLYLKTPIPATTKQLVETFLSELGDINFFRGSTVSKTERLKRLVKTCGVELIIIDEFQQFLRGLDKPSHAMRVVSDWLKVLIEQLQIPMILVGLPAAEIALRGNEQLNRRFTNRFKINMFAYETIEDVKIFKRLLLEIDKEIPISSNLADGDMPSRLHYATGGLLSFLMSLIIYSSELALKKNHDCLTKEVFAETYEKRLIHVFPDRRKNPFLAKKFVYDIENKIQGTLSDIF